MNPSGIEIRPGLLNGIGAGVVQLNNAVALFTCVEFAGTPQSAAWAAVSFAAGRLLCEPPQQIGDSSTTSTAEIRPPYRPHTAPRELNLFQNSENRIAGRFAEAAIANATATRNATFRLRANTARTIAIAPITNAEYRATFTSSRSPVLPRRITLAYRSCATLDEEARVSPATTARMVANATDAITASRTAPPLAPPKYFSPSAFASNGAAVLPPGSFLAMLALPTMAAAPKPSARVSR